MTDTLSSTQTWTQLANGASLGGSGIFGFGGTHKHKGGAGHPAASAAGTVADPSLSFNKLFANDLSQNALSETDPTAQYAAAQQAATASDNTASVDEATAGGDETTGLSGPLAPGLLAYLMGLTTSPAVTTSATEGQATADAATAAAGDDTTPPVQVATAVSGDGGSAATPLTPEDLFSELAELAGAIADGQTSVSPDTATSSAAATTDTATADNAIEAVTDQAQSDPAASPAALQATALLEMQKALSAYFSGNLTSSNTTAAATSIAI